VIRLRDCLLLSQDMAEDHQGSLLAEQAELLPAGESATRGAGSSPGGAEYVSWTFHRRIRNRQRDSPWYIVGIQAWTHHISEKMATVNDEGPKQLADNRIRV
jgi:hypothetical protein